MQTREKKALLWTFMDVVGGQGIPFLAFLIIARLIGPEQYGVFAIAMALIGLMNVVLYHGIADALIWVEDPGPSRTSTVFWMNLLLAVAIFLAIQGLAGWLAAVYHAPIIEPVLRWIAFLAPLQALMSVQIALFLRNLDTAVLARRTIVGRIAGVVVGIALAAADWGVWSLVALQLTQTVVSVVILWTATTWRPRFIFNLKQGRELARFGFCFMGGSFATALSNSVDSLIVGLFFPPDAVACYVLASRLLDMASTVLLTPMRMLVMPILSRNTAHRGVFTSSYDMMVRSTLAIWMPMLLALGIGAEVFVLALLGPQWSGAVGILQAMCLVAFTLPLSFFAGSALSAAGRPDLFFKLATAKLLTVSIFIVIGAQFSLTAVGFAWSGAFACIVPLCLFTLQKACGVNWTVGTKSALRIAAAGLGFAVCALVTINWMAAYDWPMLLSLLSGIGLGFVVYAVLLEYVLLPGFVRTALKEIRIFFVRAAPETERASGA